jgi:hypothetical protein
MENMNAENRSQMNLTMPCRAKVLRNIARHCSFCNEQGHTISTCTSELLNEFENLCLVKKEFCQNEVNVYELFMSWLLTSYTIDKVLVKSFAVRKCGAATRSNVSTILQKITNYIFSIGEVEADYLPLYTSSYGSLFTISSNLLLERLPEIENNTISSIYIVIDETIEIKTSECPICYNEINKTNCMQLNCSHEFCTTCIKNMIDKCNENPNPNIPLSCALCRSEIKEIVTSNIKIKEDFIR